MKNQKGFTIIELIVVISIIAVLASIVLVNTIQYINKSRDAAIKADLNTVMTNLISNLADGTGITASSISSDKGWIAVTKLQTDEEKRFESVDNDTQTFCACAQELATSSATFYCVDTSGSPKETKNPCSASNCGKDSEPVCPL